MLRYLDRELSADDPERGALEAVARKLDVPVSRIALSATMADYIEDALAVRPVVADAARQQALVDRYLAPVLPELMAMLLRVRAALDPDLRRERPAMYGGAYPLGQCLEITRAVQAHLERLRPETLQGEDAAALAALRAFEAEGGQLRRAWGDLRGQYFQNALLVGTLYVDVANDTVVITKPPVEILPLDQADFTPIRDHAHYARIAARYWKRRFMPNHLLPRLAPYLPLLQVTAGGGVSVGPLDPYMLGLTLVGDFTSSDAILDAPVLQDDVFASLAAALDGGPVAVATRPAAGREAALSLCRAWRAEGQAACADSFNDVMLAAHQVNRRLARLVLPPPGV